MIFSRLRRKEGSRGQWMWKKKQRARRNREKPEREREGEGGILCAKMNTGPRIEDVCTTQFFARLPSSTRFPIFVPALSSPCGIIFSRSYPRGYPMARYALRTKPLPSSPVSSSFRIPCIYPARGISFWFKVEDAPPSLRVRPVFTGGKVSSRHVNNAESKNEERRGQREKIKRKKRKE